MVLRLVGRMIELIEEQSIKAWYPIEVMLLGNSTDVNEEQLANARSPTATT
jgi:hypothetical protein